MIVDTKNILLIWGIIMKVMRMLFSTESENIRATTLTGLKNIKASQKEALFKTSFN